MLRLWPYFDKRRILYIISGFFAKQSTFSPFDCHADRMSSSTDQVLVEPQPDVLPAEQPQTSDHLANSSSDSDWALLGNLMIDLNPVGDQSPLKMQNGYVESRAPKAESEKSLKMKIKRKSKSEEKHEIVTPEVDKLKASAPKVKQKAHKDKKSIKAEDESGDDPYTFKTADDSWNSGPSAKKLRVEKPESSKKKARKDAGINTSSTSTSIEPDSLGPCEPGTSVSLDGVVWLETATGVLVVNVAWRGRTYVGTLLDATQHDFAPPCPKDYAPPMEVPRNQRGRGKRRGGGPSQKGKRQLLLSSKSEESPQPRVRCPQPGCCKVFQDLQTLKWHSLEQHSTKSSAPRSRCHNFAKQEAEDGSCVFKVPHKTVTVSKTFSVPADAPEAVKVTCGALDLTGTKKKSQQPPARKSDSASPSYSDISDEGAPVLEKLQEAPPAHSTPRSSPKVLSKPSLGLSPSERPVTAVTARRSEERRQLSLAEMLDVREAPSRPSSRSSLPSRPCESPRRPPSRPHVHLPAAFHPPVSSPGPFHPPQLQLDYRMFSSHAPSGHVGPAGFAPPGYPHHYPDKAALEALGHYAAHGQFMMPHFHPK